MINLDRLRALETSGEIDTVILAVCDLYGRLMGKRLDAGFFLEAAEDGTHVCDYLFTVDMEMEPIEGYEFSSWSAGYGDVHLVPDFNTTRVLSWQDRTALIMCDAHTKEHEPVSIAPRSLLGAQVKAAADLGFTAMAASELEYFIYRTSFEDASKSNYADLAPAGWYIEDYHLLQAQRTEDLNGAFRRHLSASGIPVESTKGEWGHGQHELNIKYCEVLEMADRHVLMKQAIKEIADQMGASATFMAKPHASEAGSSSHLHMSLWSDDQNAFVGDSEIGGIEASDTFRWFLGGWMAYAAELMVCYAPTINSYKRYQSQSWAPTAVAWSPDNRTAGFRIIGQGNALRIECRLPGADVNPYLAYSAVLASGLAGIANKIEPPPPHVGDAYADTALPTVPKTLSEATVRFAESEFAVKAFGETATKHYSHFFASEVTAYDRAVTDWERRRYFERI